MSTVLGVLMVSFPFLVLLVVCVREFNWDWARGAKVFFALLGIVSAVLLAIVVFIAIPMYGAALLGWLPE